MTLHFYLAVLLAPFPVMGLAAWLRFDGLALLLCFFMLAWAIVGLTMS